MKRAGILCLLAAAVLFLTLMPACAAEIKTVSAYSTLSQVAVYGNRSGMYPHFEQGGTLGIVWDTVQFSTPQYSNGGSYEWQKLVDGKWKTLPYGTYFSAGSYRFYTQVRTEDTNTRTDKLAYRPKVVIDGVEWTCTTATIGDTYSYAWITSPEINIKDTRTKVTTVEAKSSDLDSILRYGSVTKAPTLTASGAQSGIVTFAKKGYWEKQESGAWSEYDGYLMEEGTYRYTTQVRIDDEAGWKNKFASPLIVRINGTAWTVENLRVSENDSEATVTSPTFTVRRSAQSKNESWNLGGTHMMADYSYSRRYPYQCGAKVLSSSDTAEIRGAFAEYGLTLEVISYTDEFSVSIKGTPSKEGRAEGRIIFHSSSDPLTTFTLNLSLFIDGVPSVDEQLSFSATVGKELAYTDTRILPYGMLLLDTDTANEMKSLLQEYGIKLTLGLRASDSTATLTFTGTPTKAGDVIGWVMWKHPTQDAWYTLEIDIQIAETPIVSVSDEWIAIGYTGAEMNEVWTHDLRPGFGTYAERQEGIIALRSALQNNGLEIHAETGPEVYRVIISGTPKYSGSITGRVEWFCPEDSSAVYTLNVRLIISDQMPLPGDANGDRKVDIADAMVVLQYACGWNVSINRANADVNADGRIEPVDALMILQFVNGIIHELAQGAQG